MAVASDAVVVAEESAQEEALVEEDLLVEDVSIDGMCGVY
jgi:mycofactocin precursor